MAWRRWAALALIVILAGASTVAILGARRLGPRLHQEIIQALSHSLQSEVDLGRTTITWLPLRVHADGLTVRHHGRTDVPPLLVLKSFTIDFKFSELWTRTADLVVIDGMEITIPPKQAGTPRLPNPVPPGGDDEGGWITIRHLRATNVRLSVIPRNPDKNPRVWDIHSMVFNDIHHDGPATYQASIINPIPFGTIESQGEFGPWQAGEPSDTAVKGDYTFAADLGTIDGLSGHLDAKGTMGGIIERIETTGETSTADFALASLHAQSLPLRTNYSAVVDGTRGDVELQSVDLTLGHSQLHARGTIEGAHGKKGKRVALNIKSNAVDVGEFMRLLVKGQSHTVRGTLIVDAALDLPQGDNDIIDRLEIEGSARADHVVFADQSIQNKVDQLSRRGQGRPDDASIDDVASRMQGQFRMNNGVVSFRELTFDVEGASVRLNGRHALHPKTLDFEGEVRLHAPVSKTLTGFKTWLLKPIDPLFRKRGAGTLIAIHVEGTSEKPVVGIDLKKSIKGG